MPKKIFINAKYYKVFNEVVLNPDNIQKYLLYQLAYERFKVDTNYMVNTTPNIYNATHFCVNKKYNTCYNLNTYIHRIREETNLLTREDALLLISALAKNTYNITHLLIEAITKKYFTEFIHIWEQIERNNREIAINKIKLVRIKHGLIKFININ
jgi:hypothetical protein